MALTDEQFNKLPKYAQDAFKDQQATIRSLRSVVESLQNENPTGISTRVHKGTEQLTQHIDADYGIDFDLGDGATINVRVEHERFAGDTALIHNALRIMSNGHPSPLIVVPGVSNVMRVGVSA